MPAVTVIFPDDLLERVDTMVAERKERSTEPQRATPAQLQEAHLIAERDGVGAANKYLKSLRSHDRRPSRMALVLELVEHGLLAVAVEEAKSRAATPGAAKKRGRI